MLFHRQLYHTAIIYRSPTHTHTQQKIIEWHMTYTQSTWSCLYNTQPTSTKNPTFICRFRTQRYHGLDIDSTTLSRHHHAKMRYTTQRES